MLTKKYPPNKAKYAKLEKIELLTGKSNINPHGIEKAETFKKLTFNLMLSSFFI